ncbi:PHD finger protein 20-like protein 1 isoform X5 [Sinocyclocheilus anshuiensis]|uniref:PHD finger protein 20-like protein 1 isoform X5 n=1 Tax=Sinocyclocheilus anshuiensis TaxID=1608454 RepID=UPI0007B961BC|nr:PREDICTED: PHD finger protein 20-like protein 1 isoform X5 [Sinocyclocheilus anshuiensis]
MSKKLPNRPGIIFEVGARVEARDYLQKWYPSRIEKIDYDEGKMLVHFDRWSHRYDEWILWDSNRVRPLERPALRKEGLKEEEVSELRDGEEVLARWTDCRYYPAKIESINKEGTYTVQFYDGVIRCVKRIHIKSMPEDAKGQQDWIALVKAASAAAKNKGGNRPRTSANSNKDREDRREQQSDEELDDDEDDDYESESEKLAELDSEEEDSKPAAEELEPATAKRRSKRQGNLCSSKRMRLSKGAGCADTESECKAESKELSVTSQQKASGAEASPADERSQSVSCQKTPASLSSPSLCKSRSRRFKHDSGESTTSNQNTTAAPEPSPSPSSTHSLPDSTHTAPTNSPQRRRRSQRLATSSDQAYPSSPHTRDSSTHPPPPPPPDDSQKDVEDSSTAVKTEAPPQKPASGSPSTAPPTSVAQSPISEKDKMTDVLSSNQTTLEVNSPSVVTVAFQKVPSRTPKANKHAREPIINTKKSDDPTAPNETLIDLDHNKFKCKVPGCSKAFRKAKLLDYHLKYYHNTEKEMDSEVCSPERVGRTRATSASMPTSTLSDMPDNKRRRTVSTSSSLSSQAFMLQMDSSGCVRPPKFCKKKRSSASVSSDSTEVSLPPPNFDNLHDKIIKKEKHLDGLCIKTERKFKLVDKCQLFVKKRDKDRRDRKEKDIFRIKQKKKKKKKKKSKLHCYSDLDEMSLAYLDRPSSPMHRSSSSAFKHSTFQYPRAILSVDLTGENLSDIDFLEDSTTESLLFSGDEYNQDLDSITMEDFQDEDDDGANEIVRCICEMDEENGFMIQCEECMCWQHSVCMGLLEDSIPDHYICYICRDPPGQRWSAKYRHDKDWLQKGHMYGLSFLTENYSHQNAKKIVSTHQLLADVYSVKNLLHGLQLKMDILQNKHNPSLHLWARSWVNSDEDQPMGGVPDCLHFKEHLNQNLSPETYITSEHSYQKPPGTGLEHTRDEQGLQTASQFNRKEEEVSSAIALSGCVNDSNMGSMEQARNCLQWQMNLLTHIEDVQNQLSGRMDLIEKELDVLESWLDFTGELEPPEPLARLPQLKCRIKQLLTDLGKVQQMSTLCSV